MANIYNYLKNALQKGKEELKNNPFVVLITLVLVTIPLPYIYNSITIISLFVYTIFRSKGKINNSRNTWLFAPVIFYLIMVASLLWSIDFSATSQALVKELPLLILPISFLFHKEITHLEEQKVLKFYSYGILTFTVFYYLKALIRFAVSRDTSVFFYHELVTKDVNAIHVSVYVSIAFFWFFIKKVKSAFDYIALVLLLVMVFLLSSKNIIVVFIGLIVIHYIFLSKVSKRMRMRNLVIFIAFLISLLFIGKIRERFMIEYETNMADSTVNDVISKGNNRVYNVSIKQAWTNEKFNPNDYFPGTAFRVYQFRIFTELIQENNVFFSGFGLNASSQKIKEKAIQYHVFLGDETQEGYQTKNFHNQYVQNFAELGLFGFLILIIMLMINLKNAYKTKDFIHFAFAFLMISLFLTESFLWRQRGVVFFTTMYCLLNTRIDSENK